LDHVDQLNLFDAGNWKIYRNSFMLKEMQVKSWTAESNHQFALSPWTNHMHNTQ
jgi:hypothetical protein